VREEVFISDAIETIIDLLQSLEEIVEEVLI
jgi:hypothetical protein